MSRKFKDALKGLKDTYPAPNPEREAAFLRNLPDLKPEKKRIIPLLHNGAKPVWYTLPALVTAAVLIVAGTGIYQRISEERLPTVDVPAETTTSAVSTEVPSTVSPDVT